MKFSIHTKAPVFILLLILFTGSLVYPDNNNPKISGPGFYEIKDYLAFPVKIPFTMVNRKPVMELKINEKPAKLMIDNGILWDEVWFFGSPLIDELELSDIDTVSIGGAGEEDPTAAYISDNVMLTFENIIFHEQPTIVSPPAAGFNKMFPGIDGQLCNTFFKHFIVEFDFINNEILLHKPEDFQYRKQGSVLDMKLTDSGSHAVPLSFTMMNGKTYSDWIDLDFGGIYAIRIALNNQYKIELPEDAAETHSYGAQGRMSEYHGKIKSMTVGEYTFRDVTAIFGDTRSSRIHPNNLGIIGLPLFMKFNTTFDYINYKLYLTPNKNLNRPFEQYIR